LEGRREISIEMAEEQAAAAGSSAVGRAVEEVRSALNEHADVVAELFGRVSSELRTGFAPAVDSFIGFFHAIDWKVPPTNSPICPLCVRAWI
jgi:transmembrane protein 18